MPTPPTAQDVATAWVEAVMDDGDLARAWPLTHPTLRLVLVQDWIWAHRHQQWLGHGSDWDGLATRLAAVDSGDSLWLRFSAELLELWQKIWKGFSTLTWRSLDDPEVVDLDLETVTFVETEAAQNEAKRYSFARRFALRHSDDGWQVASINGDQMFVPGWPPSLEDRH